MTDNTLRLPDNPCLVSLDYLRRVDGENPPGALLAQSKLNGHRRVALFLPHGWIYISKYSAGPAARALPASVKAPFEGHAWPAGIGIDCEWVGPRGGAQALWVFDLCYYRGEWCGDMPFSDRHAILASLAYRHTVRCYPNPGLVDVFYQELTVPQSEGLVIRRADSKLIGKWDGFAESGTTWKVKFQRKHGGGKCL